MLYKQPRFTLPTTNKSISELEYEIAVGLRCPDCKEIVAECKCQKQ